MLKLTLRKIQKKDRKYFAQWWRDKELIKLTSGILKPLSDQELSKSFFALLTTKSEFHFLITLSGEVIGHISLSKKDNGWHETQVIIGEKQYRNQGYGTKAIKSMIGRAKKTGISKIYLEVRPDNLRAIRAYKKAGFQKTIIKKYPQNKYLSKTLRMEYLNQLQKGQ